MGNADRLPAAAGPTLLAGVYQSIITPPIGAPLLGTIQRSTGVHDELYARVLVLNDGTERIAIVCLDLIGMDFALSDEVRRKITEQTGITSILLNCSHTHSSPFTIPWSVLGPRWVAGPGKAWRDQLATQIARTVFQADAAPVEAILRVGRAPVQVGYNRRLPTDAGIVMKPNPSGRIVPWVDVLRVDHLNGKPAAVLFTHAAHPVIIHGASRSMSADFPGYAMHHLNQQLGTGVMTLFGQSCGAQINGEPLRGGFDAAEKAGQLLAHAAYQAASESIALPQRPLKFKSISGELPLQPLPTAEQCGAALAAAEAKLAKVCGTATFTDEQLWDLQDAFDINQRTAKPTGDETQPMDAQPWWLMDNVLCLRDLMDKVKRGDETPLRFDAHLLRVGNEWSLLAATHELFAEYQLWFDQNGPTRQKMMLAYTNGCESYIPTEEELPRGGYESATFPSLDGAALKYCHRRAVRPGVEERVKEHFRSLWR